MHHTIPVPRVSNGRKARFDKRHLMAVIDYRFYIYHTALKELLSVTVKG